MASMFRREIEENNAHREPRSGVAIQSLILDCLVGFASSHDAVVSVCTSVKRCGVTAADLHLASRAVDAMADADAMVEEQPGFTAAAVDRAGPRPVPRAFPRPLGASRAARRWSAGCGGSNVWTSAHTQAINTPLSTTPRSAAGRAWSCGPMWSMRPLPRVVLVAGAAAGSSDAPRSAAGSGLGQEHAADPASCCFAAAMRASTNGSIRGAAAGGGEPRRFRSGRRRCRGDGIDRGVRAAFARGDRRAGGAEAEFRAGSARYPHYTRPREWQGRGVPEVLLSATTGGSPGGGASRRND